MSVDIFASAKEKVMPEWAKFVSDGDTVQGTYIGKIVGQVDGYGNEQIIYQLLQDDGRVVNVGFGLNKKVMHQDMAQVRFGQIIGFKYKGTITVKNKLGKTVDVKDFSLFQDPKIVNTEWMNENKDNMPVVVNVGTGTPAAVTEEYKKQSEVFEDETADVTDNDVPFSSEGSLTNEDKLALIQKLAKEKLGAKSAADAKDKVMETTGVAFIPVNYDKIVDALSSM